jgi:hypothetical protein
VHVQEDQQTASSCAVDELLQHVTLV